MGEGIPISRKEALEMAREIMETAERERLEALERECAEVQSCPMSRLEIEQCVTYVLTLDNKKLRARVKELEGAIDGYLDASVTGGTEEYLRARAILRSVMDKPEAKEA